MRLTDLSIKRLRVPEMGQVTYTDDTLPGFGVRVSRGGVRSFVLVIGRNRKRITIGRYPTITLHEARGRARELVAQRVLGKEDLPSLKFEDAIPIFLASQYPEHSLKPRTKQETQRVLRRHFLPPLRYENLHAITTLSVTSIVDRMRKTPSEARHAFAVIRLFFRWAERRRYVLRSPCVNVQPPKAGPPRERVLSKDELKRVLLAARSKKSTYTDIVQLLIYTGQRRGEIAALERSWIDFERRTITFPAKITKNKRQHTIPFGPPVEEVLLRQHDEGCLFRARGKKTRFDGWSKGKPKFDRLCPMPGWTLHDLRRTFATNLAALGVPIHVTEKLLNHVSGTLAGIVAVYQRHTYQDEMREAIDAWEAYLRTLLCPEQERASVEQIQAVSPALLVNV
jgi:integrase